MGQPRLLELVRRKCRLKHLSYRTEQAYLGWIKRYVRYHQMIHPLDLGDDAVEQFLSDLATTRGVSASTQNQALAAILFLYKEVLGRASEHLSFTRAHSSHHLPVVLSDVRWMPS